MRMISAILRNRTQIEKGLTANVDPTEEKSESEEEELPPLLEAVSRKKGYVSSYNPVPRGHDISKACSTYLQHVGKFKERKSGNAVMFVRQFEEALSIIPRIN